LELEDFDSLSIEENHELAVRHFNEGRYFPAHEAWETAWKKARDSGDAEFFKGLSQLGAGYVHLLRGNRHGAFTLLRRAAGRIAPYPVEHRGIDTRSVAERAEHDADAVERGEIEPGPDALRDAPHL
jgi:predicted metal-dependent hydrolase